MKEGVNSKFAIFCSLMISHSHTIVVISLDYKEVMNIMGPIISV